MSKYNNEDKKIYIELMESAKHSIRSAAKEAGIPKSVGERWWKTYQSLGMEFLLNKSTIKSQNYSLEFKLHGIKYRKDKKLSLNQAAADLGITADALARWEKLYFEEGEAVFCIKMNEKPPRAMKNKEYKDYKANSLTEKEAKELIAENERLRAEIDYIKKCIALTQQKRKSQAKKKQK